MMSREEILKQTSNGLYIFRHYIKGNWKIGEKFLNPFYHDTNKDCSIYYHRNSGKYKICDQGNKLYSGDCFAFVGVLNGLDSNNPSDFHKILAIIYRDMNIRDTMSEPTIYAKSAEPQPIVEEEEEPSPPKRYAIATRDFNTSEIAFWNRVGITKETLARFNVVAIEKFDSIKNDGQPYTLRSTVDKPIFGYLNKGYVKIYRPYSSNRFLYGGKKPEIYCFGLEQLPTRGDVVFITAGEKDVMSLSVRGFSAISFNSETAHISRSIIERLSFMFRHIVILYDMDKTGIRRSKELTQTFSEFNVKRIELPLSGVKGEKDISDFFRLGGTAEQLRAIFVEMLNSLYDNTIAVFNSCEVDLDAPPKPTEGIISINGVVLGSKSDLLCVTGGEGTGKSNFIGALIAGAISSESESIDTLGVTIKRCRSAVVLYDTEQSKAQLHKNSLTILSRAKLSTKPDSFKPYSIMALPRKVRLQHIIDNMDYLYHKFGGIHLVVVDGVADLVRSANDESESIAVVEELYRLAAIYNTCIVCVLHYVPSGLKLRGHLGSELQRKAAAIISIERDDDPKLSVIKAVKVRDGCPLDVPILQFAWSEEARMHTYRGAKSKEERNQRKYEELVAVVNEIFRTDQHITYAELCTQLQAALSVKDRTAKSYIKYLRDREIVINSGADDNHLILKTT
ncbi:MAG: bifunctional DNA primase/helicase [Rikenellaceae bacterium]